MPENTRLKQLQNVMYDQSLLSAQDIYLFKEGTHYKLHEKLGSHPTEFNGVKGTFFAVWAPNALRVSVMGDFNEWDRHSHPLASRWDSSGIWEGFIPHIGHGTVYKYHILSNNQLTYEKGDPFAYSWEIPPRTASIVWNIEYKRTAENWKNVRNMRNSLKSPMSIYEMHFGSWRRVPEENNRPLSYKEMTEYLPGYLKNMGFTHVEFLPMMEHPFCGSWGYQKVGYFSPSSRYGSPQDFMYLIDTLHENEIGVILDWVPSHFPSDGHGLAFFDGTHLYEHEDPRQGYHPDWKSYIFNYGRNEVRAFLISSAVFWFEKFQVDGLRVDGVASMIYLDYSRKEGEWIPNVYGGKENLSAISFLQTLNHVIYENFPYAQMIAEESTAWTGVTRPTFEGGLGFGMKWNMGWMHDILVYMSRDPIHRKFHQNEITFSLLYAFSENFTLAFSHDEVVHGKGSLVGKMPGDEWQKYANLRLLFGYMFGHPGKKLLFMGAELGQRSEWNHSSSLDWDLLQYPCHQGTQNWVRDLNKVYKLCPSLYEVDFSWEGFEWIDAHDSENCILSFIRKDKKTEEVVLVVCNFTPVPRYQYRIGVPRGGTWQELLNSDGKEYWGSGLGNYGKTEAEPYSCHGKPYSLRLTLPPLAVLFFRS